MGLVHLRNHIEQVRPLRVDEEGTIRTWLDGRHDTDRGQEFDVFTEITVRGERVWGETCVFMARRLERDTSKPFGARISAGEGVPAPDAEIVQPTSPDTINKLSLSADKNIGWRYARVSSDFNPIHLVGVRRDACSASISRSRTACGRWRAASRALPDEHIRCTVSRRRGVQAARVAACAADA